jgi:hypothetical protein
MHAGPVNPLLRVDDPLLPPNVAVETNCAVGQPCTLTVHGGNFNALDQVWVFRYLDPTTSTYYACGTAAQATGSALSVSYSPGDIKLTVTIPTATTSQWTAQSYAYMLCYASQPGAGSGATAFKTPAQIIHVTESTANAATLYTAAPDLTLSSYAFSPLPSKVSVTFVVLSIKYRCPACE